MFQKIFNFVVVLLLVHLIDQSEAGGKYFDDVCYIRSNETEKYIIELRKDSSEIKKYIIGFSNW